MQENSLRRLTNEATETFYAKNPGFNLLGTNLYRSDRLDSFNWEGTDREEAVKQFKAHQRVLKLCMNPEIAKALMDNGLDSAHKIAAFTEEQFMEKYREPLSINEEDARKIHKNASDIKAKVIHLWANIRNSTASPFSKSLNAINTRDSVTEFLEGLPSYEELFGSQDYYEVDEASSIYGPAAYLTDLLRIVDKYVDNPNIPQGLRLYDRRPDLKEIELTAENVNGTMPYLQLVNEILGGYIKNNLNIEDEFSYLAQAKYPLNAPFNLPLEEIRTYLGQLKLSLHDVYRAFDLSGSNALEIARESLQLSCEEFDIITSPIADDSYIREIFDFSDEEMIEINQKGTLPAEVFLEKTGISRQRLVEMVYQDLSDKEISSQPSICEKFYINAVPDSLGFITISVEKDSLGVEFERINRLDLKKLNRMNCFIRLAGKLGWSYADLDWVLTSLGSEDIDEVTIIDLAKIKGLVDQYKVSPSVLSCMWFDIKTTGEGSGGDSKSLFDVLFNRPELTKNRTAGVYHPKTSGNQPPELNSLYDNPLYHDTMLFWNWAENSASTSALETGKSLVVGGIQADYNNLRGLAAQVFGNEEIIPLSVIRLSVLYRHVRLSQLLGLMLPDYLILLTLLDKSTAGIFTVDEIILISETAAWMKKSGFNVYEMDYILRGIESPYVNLQVKEERINRFLTSLKTFMGSTYLNEKSFIDSESDTDSNLSGELYRRFLEAGLVDSGGIVLIENIPVEFFKRQYEVQYKMIFAGVTDSQTEFALQKVFEKRSEQQNKWIEQLAVFFGVSTELMSVLAGIATDMTPEYGDNAVRLFAEVASNSGYLDQDVVYNYMKIISRYALLSQKLKLTASELTSAYTEHIAYDIVDFKTLTLGDLRALYDFKQLTGDFKDQDDGFSGLLGKISRKANLEDLSAYISKPFREDAVNHFMSSIGTLMEGTYLDKDTIISDKYGIDSRLSEVICGKLLSKGLVDFKGIVLLEDITLSAFKEQYQLLYNEILGSLSEASADFVLNTVFERREMQQDRLINALAGFYGIQTETMDIQVQIASRLLVEDFQNWVQLFTGNIPLEIARKFMTVLALYFLLAQKLGLNAGELESLFLKNCADDLFEIRELKLESILTFTDFKRVVDEITEDQHKFKGSFKAITEEAVAADLLQDLYQLTGWDKEGIKALSNFFYKNRIPTTLKELYKLKTCFDPAKVLGTDVFFLLELLNVRNLTSDHWEEYTLYARKVLEAVKARYSADSWNSVYQGLLNAIEEKKRNILLSTVLWVIRKIGSNMDVKDPRDLYGFLLLDVEMGGCAQISSIKAALNSVQLYLQRCRLNLEKNAEIRFENEVWWEWLMNYRVWQANRKVFLYPENYIDPSLRKTKTSLFKSLEESLMQSDITSETIEAAFTKYLDEFTQLAKLKYTDSYYCTVNYPNRGSIDTLFLFSQTETAPCTYYFCTRETRGAEGDVWTEWKKIDLSINARYITPVFAYNRMFIFWAEMKKISQPTSNDNKNTSYKLTVKYSFYNFSGTWAPPQTLSEDKVVYVSNDVYLNNVKYKNGSSYPILFNMEDVFWQKVYALNVSLQNYGIDPDGTSRSEKIIAAYGPFHSVVISKGDLSLTAIPGQYENDPDRSNFEENIARYVSDYDSLLAMEKDSYLPLEEAFVLNGNLKEDFLIRSSEFLTVEKTALNNTSTFKAVLDRMNSSLGIEYSDSTLIDNYFGDDVADAVKSIDLSVIEGVNDDLADNIIAYLYYAGKLDNSGRLTGISQEDFISLLKNANLMSEDDKIKRVFHLLSKPTMLFSKVSRSNVRVITVKNQPDMFIFDNGDETFLISASNLPEERKGLQISTYLKVNASILTIKSNSFVMDPIIDISTSERIYNCFLSKNMIDGNGKVKDILSWYLLKVSVENDNPLTEYQIALVKSIIQQNLPYLETGTFISSTINEETSGKIVQSFFPYIVDQDGKITDTFIYDKKRLMITICMKEPPLNENQIQTVKEKLNTTTPDTIIDKMFFADYLIDGTLSKDVYNSLISKGILGNDGKPATAYLSNKEYLITANYLQPLGLNSNQINSVKETLHAAGTDSTLSGASFITQGIIDNTTSGNIYQMLMQKGLILGNGKMNVMFFEDPDTLILQECLEHLQLEPQQFTVIRNKMAGINSSTEFNTDSFITFLNINAQTSENIFNNFKSKGVIDTQGKMIGMFFNDNEGLIISLCIKDFGITLTDEQINEVKNKFIKSMPVLNVASFVLNNIIDTNASAQIFHSLEDAGLIDEHGRINGKTARNRETVIVSKIMDTAGIHLTSLQLERVMEIISVKVPCVYLDSFINNRIDRAKSQQIFNILQSYGIIDSQGVLTQNFGKNTNLSVVLKGVADKAQVKDVQRVLRKLFVPVFISVRDDGLTPTPLEIGEVKFSVTRITTGAVEHLSRNLFTGGIEPLLSLESQEEPKNPQDSRLVFNRLDPKENIMIPAGKEIGERVDFDGPYGNYYWELFFHAPMLVAEKLNSSQKFQEAKKWYEYIFNPTADLGKYWGFEPFYSDTLDTLLDMLNENRPEVAAYNDEPFDPHAIARLRTGAYKKAVVMKYIDNLLDWGDYLFSQYTWETITEATLLYIYSYDILGSRPKSHGPIRLEAPVTYGDIQSHYGTNIPQFLIDMENLLIQGQQGTSGLELLGKPFNDIDIYFPVPENKEFESYWDRVEDRLFKIRHCLNIKGERQPLALFEPELDIRQLVRAAASDNNVFDVLLYTRAVLPCYRFTTLLERAKNTTSTLIQLGSSLLSALEKNDAEALLLLRSTHELNILNMTTLIKEKQITEMEKNIEALHVSLDGAINRRNSYQSYIDRGLNSYEKDNQNLMIAALAFQSAASLIKLISIPAYLLPNVFGLANGGMDFGSAVNAGASLLESISSTLNQGGALAANMGQFVRREEEWTLQKQSSEYEAEQIQKSIESNEVRLAMTRQELATHLRSIEQSAEEEDFLKSKFSNKDLYNWMVGRISMVYFQTYRLSLEMSLDAQRAYQYELTVNDNFINLSYWDSLKKGLLAGESLMLSLQQMEKSYLANNTRRLEIEKTISLVQLDPEAFLKFKYGGDSAQKGVCEFKLNEALFDYDFPGHYCRQIKSVSISIPAVVGPYQNINATLTQMSNSVLLKPDIEAVEFLIAPNANSPKPGSDTLRENWIPNQQIAVSRGIDDTGMFLLNFNDERYLPFEGTGAISSWKLTMPPETNRINFESISDILIKVSYTALDGGEGFSGQVKQKLSSAGSPYIVYKYFDLKQSFSAAWHALTTGSPEDHKRRFEFTLDSSLILPNLKNVFLESVCLKLETEDGTVVSGSSEEDRFIQLKINASQFYAVPVTGNIGLVQDIGSSDFTGRWVFEFDMEKPAAKILLDAGKLSGMKLLIRYATDLFNG